MMNITKEHMAAIEATAREKMEQVKNGTPAREIMAQIYVENLEYKTQRQGLMMAEEALETLADFNEEYQKAVENAGETLDDFAEKITKDQPITERCATWFEIYSSIALLNNQLSKEKDKSRLDVEKLIEEVEHKTFTEEEATPELEKELREKAMEALSHSGILFHALENQADTLEELENQGVSELLIRLGADELEYEGILTMLAYVNIKNGTFEELPADMTIDQVAVAVAAGIEQDKIMERAGLGKIAMDVAALLLDILGMVVIIKLAMFALGKGLALASTLFGAVMFLPAVMVIGALVAVTACRGFDVWDKEARQIVKGAAVAVSTVAKGLRAVWSFVTGAVLPGILHMAKEAVSYILKKLNKAAASEYEIVTEGETVPAE